MADTGRRMRLPRLRVVIAARGEAADRTRIRGRRRGRTRWTASGRSGGGRPRRGAWSGREGLGQCLVIMFLFCCMINFIIYASGGDKRRLGARAMRSPGAECGRSRWWRRRTRRTGASNLASASSRVRRAATGTGTRPWPASLPSWSGCASHWCSWRSSGRLCPPSPSVSPSDSSSTSSPENLWSLSVMNCQADRYLFNSCYTFLITLHSFIFKCYKLCCISNWWIM